jgi:hypothetical protein
LLSENDRPQQNIALELTTCDSAIVFNDSDNVVQEKNTNSASIEIRQSSFNVIKLNIEPAHKNYDTIPSQYDPKSNIERGKIFCT